MFLHLATVSQFYTPTSHLARPNSRQNRYLTYSRPFAILWYVTGTARGRPA